MTTASEVRRIAELFEFGEVVSVDEFESKGNINLDTFLVRSRHRRFLLQKINGEVFPNPERVMAGMAASLRAQATSQTPSHWIVMEISKTRSGQPYLNDNGEVWRAVTFIENAEAFKSLDAAPETLRRILAYEVGRGFATYTDLTSGIDPADFAPSLPGYRNTEIYFAQFDAAIAGVRDASDIEHFLPVDQEERRAVERHFATVLDEKEYQRRRNDGELAPFVETVIRHRDVALGMHEKRVSGEIRTTLVHGDTKIENFLFDKETHRVISLVDLDTVMPHTWLSDWGDMARSLCNEAGEKTTNIHAVAVHRGYYCAVLEGFLKTASTVPSDEVELMPRSVQWITLELGARFLADYLRGDTYFALAANDPPDLNKTRAMVQIQLFNKLLEHEPEADELIRRFQNA